MQRHQRGDPASLAAGLQPELAELYNEVVGKEWPLQLDKLRSVVKFADDKAFQQQFMTIKRHNKEKLVKVIKAETGIEVSSEAIFDVQIKRLHEYKRQQLNLIHIMALYRRLLANPDYDMHPRVFIFGSKAAPGYKLAKDIIYAINKLAERVNNDARIQGKLKVVFMPNYRVSLAEKLIPAADVRTDLHRRLRSLRYRQHEDGAQRCHHHRYAGRRQHRDRRRGGAENCAIFGLNVDEVKALKGRGYNPYDFYYANSELKAVLDWFDTDYFTPGRPGELSSIKCSLLEGGSLPDPGRFRLLLGSPQADRYLVSGSGPLGEEGHHQLGHHGQVQLRSFHPGLCGSHLAIETLQHRLMRR